MLFETDTQTALKDRRPQNTWFSALPFARIDHIFVGGPLEVADVRVVRTRLSKVASDHLPLVVEIHRQNHKTTRPLEPIDTTRNVAGVAISRSR